jgi:hypothetical protein
MSTHAGTPTWQTVNISRVERAARVLIGVAAIVAGAVLLSAAGSVLAVTLKILLVAAGVDMAVTGGSGHCPLYQKLGDVPTSLRSTR